MPIFEYRCADCRAVFEELIRSGDERDALSCPTCHSRHTERLLSVFAGHGSDTKKSVGTAAHSCGSPNCCRVAR